jgi:hypothetical protein
VRRELFGKFKKNRMDNKKTIVIAGSVMSRSGYGAHSRDIATALIRSGKYDVKIIPIVWGNTPLDALDVNNPDHRAIKDRIIPSQLTFKPDIFIHITIPNEFQKVGEYNVGITAGIETTVCRAEWIEGCNRMDLVIATSEHSKNVFVNSSYEKRDKQTNRVISHLTVNRPIEVLFEGIDFSIYDKVNKSKTKIINTINEIPEDFCFLFVGHWLQGEFGQDRKDVAGMIRTFLESFKRKSSKNQPALVLKTSQSGFSEPEKAQILEKIQKVKNMVRGSGWTQKLPPIYVLYGDLTDDEMNDLYNHKKIKAMVSFTKGEGFGRPLLEFTTTGKPVIASGWSGQVDFLHPEYSVPLPGKLTPVHQSAVNDWIIEGSQWFTVNYQMASQILSDVHKNYSKYLEKSRKHRKITKDNFSFEKMTEKLCEYLDKIEDYSKKIVTNPKNNTPQQASLKLPKLKKVDTSTSSVPKKIKLPKLVDTKQTD